MGGRNLGQINSVQIENILLCQMSQICLYLKQRHFLHFFFLTKTLQMVILLTFVGSINNRKSDPGFAERGHQLDKAMMMME